MLKEIIRNYKKQSYNVALGWFITSLFIILFVVFTIVMIEYAVPSKNINKVITFGIIYFLVNIFRAVFNFFEDLSDVHLAKELEADYREKIYIKLQKLSQKEIDKIKVGEILENIINDTKEFSRWYGTGICRTYFGGVVRLVGILLVLMYLDIPIILVTFIIYLIGFSITYYFNKKSILYTKLKREINAKILNWSNEQVQGYSTIKALELEEERIKEIKLLLDDYEKVVNKLEKNIRIYTCLYNFIISFISVLNILYGSISIQEGLLSYGVVIILSRYISSPEIYAKWIIEGLQIRNVSKLSYSRINAILQKSEEEIDTGINLDKVYNVNFENIKFSYNNKDNVLNDISFDVSKNEKIALIGRTGSGKTSLVNIICRFYDPTFGSIKINGKDIKEYSIKSLRSKIGYIMQRVVIFNGTILENINFANKDISKEEIIKICKKLNLHKKIMSLENGYETIITSDTDIFSAGEKQLLNFTRVMVENPEIIILDEVTASLSYKSELMVREAIDEITKGKISFIIAHRLSTIKKCDKILFLKDGKILESGTHDELMEKKKEYYNLINL